MISTKLQPLREAQEKYELAWKEHFNESGLHSAILAAKVEVLNAVYDLFHFKKKQPKG